MLFYVQEEVKANAGLLISKELTTSAGSLPQILFYWHSHLAASKGELATL